MMEIIASTYRHQNRGPSDRLKVNQAVHLMNKVYDALLGCPAWAVDIQHQIPARTKVRLWL